MIFETNMYCDTYILYEANCYTIDNFYRNVNHVFIGYVDNAQSKVLFITGFD